jgi:hypothetical protein
MIEQEVSKINCPPVKPQFLGRVIVDDVAHQAFG